MADVNEIISALIEQTIKGPLKWVSTVEEGSFVASIGTISVVIRELETDLRATKNGHQLKILNASGETAEVVETEPPVRLSNFGILENPRSKRLERLYIAARRSAVGTEATLDELARNLGITE